LTKRANSSGAFSGPAMSVDPTSVTAVQGLDPSRARIAGAIKQASDSTGASFGYLVAAAKIESNLQPTAAASTSSARGLYQFIEQTWLGTVKQAGASFGYSQYADAITQQPSGAYTVSDPATRQQILKLRDDPAANAAMAGVLTQSNSFKLVSSIGRRPGDNELYMAHFLGVGGAAKLIHTNDTNPQASAAQMFPQAAAANRPIFYDKSGDARSVGGVYAELTQRYQAAVNSKAAQTAIAYASGAPATTAPAAMAFASMSADKSYLAAAPQASSSQLFDPSPTGSTRATPPTTTVPATQQVASAGNDQPKFRSLYQVGDRAEPISPTVRELWNTGQGQAQVQGGQLQAVNQVNITPEIKLKAPTPLDLFSDPEGTFAS
jgi:hypothetical protein